MKSLPKKIIIISFLREEKGTNFGTFFKSISPQTSNGNIVNCLSGQNEVGYLIAILINSFDKKKVVLTPIGL